MITVYGIRPHHAGFGTYQRDAEGQTFEGLGTAGEYVDHVRGQNLGVVPLAEEDEEYERVKDADGKVYDQNGGTVIGWKDRDGAVMLELVCEG